MTDVAPVPDPNVPAVPAEPAPAPVPVLDQLLGAATDVLDRLRVAATSNNVDTVRSWISEHFG